MRKIVIDPVTRLEGHLKVMVNINGGKVVNAEVAGTLYRGFETILSDRDPRDAILITQRICGVCPADHATAAALALDDLCSVQSPHNGRLLRNLVLGGNYLQSHITHFYHLSLPDYVQGPAIAPFSPSYTGDFRLSKAASARMMDHYFKALKIRRTCHEFVAHFAGKMPHQASIVVGGIAQNAARERVDMAGQLLATIREFIHSEYEEDAGLLANYYADYFKIGKGPGNLLAYGAFPLDHSGEKMLFDRGIYLNGQIATVDGAKITEDVSHAWYRDSSAGNPALIHTEAQVGKKGAYSWVKAPRYDGKVCEVGPLARMWLSGRYRNGISAMDRIVARMEEAKVMVAALATWLDELDMSGECLADVTMPDQGMGAGMTEAARGALGHWVAVKNGKIDRYEAVVPTTWNASPRDKAGQPGPIEAALQGIDVPDADNPLPVIRVIHSFDPCLACAVHLIESGTSMKEFTI